MAFRSKGEGGIASSILRVGLANALKVLCGVLVGFALPRLLSVDGYGYVRTCTLYATYVGLFSTGIIDGIALRFGGTPLEQLDQSSMRRYGRTFLLLEVLFAAAGCLAGLLSGSSGLRFLLCWQAAFLLTNNITSYCQMLSQITGRFQELSRFTGLQSLLGALAVVILWVTRGCTGDDTRLYLLLYTAANTVTLVTYLFRWREMFLGVASSWQEQKKSVRQLIRTGTPLMLANLSILLILSADRQFVSLLFDSGVFAVYAFAYNIVTMITMVISAISTVLFPTMMRMDKKQLLSSWPRLSLGVPLLVFGCMLIYYPLIPFIRWFLPAYTQAMNTLRIIFPGLAVSSVITIVIHNYDKTLGLSDRFCLQAVMTLALSVGANALAYIAIGSTNAISGASVLVLWMWYLLSGSTLRRRFGLRLLPASVFLAAGSLMFWMCTSSWMPIMPGAILYLLFIIASGIVFIRHFQAVKA